MDLQSHLKTAAVGLLYIYIFIVLLFSEPATFCEMKENELGDGPPRVQTVRTLQTGWTLQTGRTLSENGEHIK